MFSKSVREPIEDGGKLDEAEEGNGELAVAGGDAAARFDPAAEVFDLTAVPVVAAMETGRLPATAFGRDTAVGALGVQSPAEGVSIQASVGHDPAAHAGQQPSDGVLVVLRARRETDGHRPPPASATAGSFVFSPPLARPIVWTC